jgi:hypothetical protein
MSRSRAEEELEANLAFHRREWRIQRIGWVLVAVFLALAVGGLFGHGPLSRAYVDYGTGRLEYEQFVRYGLSTDLVITDAGSAQGVIRVAISGDYLEAFRVERITPEPAAVRMAGPNIVYEFASAAPGASISFHLRPQRLWRRTATVTIDGGEPLHLSQFTYP